jgi:hypothetical protein
MNDQGPFPTASEAAPTQPVRAPRVARGALVFAATTAIVVSAAVAFAASPSAEPRADEETSPQETEVVEALPMPGGAGWYAPDGAPGAALGHIGHRLDGRLEITITSIDGSQVALETANGWSRTIDASGAAVTRGDEEIAVSDLQVGEHVVLAEDRNDDGSWTVTAIHVVMPHTGGVVTAVGSDAITVERPDGTTTTIAVTQDTTYTVPGVDEPGLDDIAVDDLVVARGTLDADGTLIASEIWGGIPRNAIRERLDERLEDRFDGPFERGRHDGPGWLDGEPPWLRAPDARPDEDLEGSTDEEESGADGANS